MISPRTFLALSGLAVGAACWTAGFAIHGLPGPDWLNWKGWGWIFSPITAGIGVCYGWSIRGSSERSRWFRSMLLLRRTVTPEEWLRARQRAFPEGVATEVTPDQVGAVVTQFVIANRMIDVENARR